MTCGKISASANSRTDLRNWSCSGVYSKSTALNYLFLSRVPVHRALLAIAFHCHAAGNGNAESQVEWAVGLGAGVADGVQEVLHMGFGIGLGHPDHLVGIG